NKCRAVSPESEAMSQDLKKRGFSFVGPTICYAYMQSIGMVNDHHVDCFLLSKEEDEIQSNPNILPKLGSTLFLWSIMFSIIMNADWSEELRLGYGSLVVGCAMGCVLFWCLTVVLVELMAAFPFT
ncbi:hypothetical protein HDU99_006451, partial [Rhizoclosmatium hyalinum]